MWHNLEVFFLKEFGRILEILGDSSILKKIERIWKLLMIRFFFNWKNLKWIWENLGNLWSCCWNSFKKSRGLFVFGFWSSLKESREIHVFYSRSSLKESLEIHVFCFWSSLKESREHLSFDFDVVYLKESWESLMSGFWTSFKE